MQAFKQPVGNTYGDENNRCYPCCPSAHLSGPSHQPMPLPRPNTCTDRLLRNATVIGSCGSLIELVTSLERVAGCSSGVTACSAQRSSSGSSSRCRRWRRSWQKGDDE